MLILLIFSAFLSWLACAVMMRFGRNSAKKYSLFAPQRFHAGDVPRLGGVAILLACAWGWAWMVVAGPYFGIANGISFDARSALIWFVITLAAMGGGVAEDLTHKLGPAWRLGGTLAAGIAAAWLLDARIVRLGVPPIDWLLGLHSFVPVILAVFAVAGLPHAFNLIDGYNGLASTVATICCLAIGYVALQVGDRQLAGVVVTLCGATLGFLAWNYPRGLIFAGDGGAYLWGGVIALAVIQLVQRHPQVSPWFAMLLLIYPVWETLFSSYRKLVRGQSPGLADALHFHQLIYRRIVRGVWDEDQARRMLVRNNRTAPYLWGFTLLTVIPAVLFWDNTPVLMGFCALFVVSYLYAYIRIVRFKVPQWLRR